MAFIDRDPDEMIRYAKEAEALATNMDSLITNVDRSLSHFSSDLNSDCQKAIAKLSADIKSFKNQIEYFNSISKSIDTKAKKQIEAKNSLKGL